MKKRILVMVLTLCPLFMTGCATDRSITYDYGSKNLTQENTDKIIRGKTTKAEVLAILGKPAMKQTSSLGEMWIYTRSIMKQKLMFLGGWAYDPNDSKTSSASITFDDNGIVKDISSFEMGTIMTGTVEYK